VDAVAGARATADHDRLLQVVSNLTENALRVTPSGGVVGIRARPGTIGVTDTGPGLAPEDIPRAFERFHLHAKYGGDRPVGSGLGLAIAQQLVRAMGGRVEVHSALGQGTTFVVTLPPASDDVPAPPPGQAPASLEGWFEEEPPA
jgi:signal transduction histidine kinase